MAGLLDNQTLDFECPNCRQGVKMTIGQLKRMNAQCPKCGAEFNSSQLRQELDQVERKLKDFGTAIGEIKININL